MSTESCFVDWWKFIFVQPNDALETLTFIIPFILRFYFIIHYINGHVIPLSCQPGTNCLGTSSVALLSVRKLRSGPIETIVNAQPCILGSRPKFRPFTSHMSDAPIKKKCKIKSTFNPARQMAEPRIVSSFALTNHHGYFYIIYNYK